jgi:hypothetical protein
MIEAANENKLQRFHVVQLAVFNAQVLSGIQDGADQGDLTLRSLLEQTAANNVTSKTIPSTVNQSLFFGMAYLTLVWLKESLSKEENDQILASERMFGVWQNVRTKGPRDVSEDAAKMRLIRNALSHANVEIKAPFDFEFCDKSSREDVPTYLYIGSHDLGQLCQQFYLAASDVLYSCR